jgi:hypothetical protein
MNIIIASLSPDDPQGTTVAVPRDCADLSAGALAWLLDTMWAWNIHDDPSFPEYTADGPAVFVSFD